jgi:hypothetical protein
LNRINSRLAVREAAVSIEGVLLHHKLLHRRFSDIHHSLVHQFQDEQVQPLPSQLN